MTKDKEADKKDDKDEAFLKPEFYEQGGATRAEIAIARDEYLRNKIAKERGLRPNPTWEDINRARAETTRKLAARQLTMDSDTPWDKIVEEERKRR